MPPDLLQPAVSPSAKSSLKPAAEALSASANETDASAPIPATTAAMPVAMKMFRFLMGSLSKGMRGRGGAPGDCPEVVRSRLLVAPRPM
ncbi:hypothetical protein ACTI_19280 [Actinoplanes sp. OR16]|nr:hypothetical protein ACTI_19280 [Actinoplanes sp. OR16]